MQYGALFCKCKKSRFGPTGGFCMDPKRSGGHIYGKSNNFCVNTGLAAYVQRVLPNTAPTMKVHVAGIGCGTGGYGKLWSGSEQIIWRGFDGSENIEDITNGEVMYVDFSEAQYELPGGPFDWVISIEVAEHVPKRFEQRFVSNLIKNAKVGIILSWAKVGQGGDGHVNERDEPWVKERFEKEGLKLDEKMTFELRESITTKGRKANVCPWLQHTLFAFRFSQQGTSLGGDTKLNKARYDDRSPDFNGHFIPVSEVTSYPYDDGVKSVHIGWKGMPNPCLKQRLAKIISQEPYKLPDDYEISFCEDKINFEIKNNFSGISVCVPPVYGTLNSTALNDWINHTMRAGVSNFFLYTMEPKEPSIKYDSGVQVLSVPWMKNKMAWERGQMWTVYDCLHRVRTSGGRWVIFMDYDEYLHLPKFENLSKITALLEDKKFKAASFGKVNYQQKCRSEYPIVYDPTLPFLCSTPKQKPNLCDTHFGERKYMVDVVATLNDRFKVHKVEAKTYILDGKDAHLMHCRGRPFNQKEALEVQKIWFNKRQLTREMDKMKRVIQVGKVG